MTRFIEKAISEMKKHPDRVQDAMAGSNCGDQGSPIAGVRAHPLLIHRAIRLVASALVAVLFVMTAATVAQASPNIKTISRETPTSEHTNADVLTWKITFSEPVASATHHTKNVDPTDFTVSGTTATLTLTPLALDAENCSREWHATLSGGDLADLNGTVTIEPNIIVKDGLDFDGHNPLEKPDIWGCIGYGEEMTNPGPLGQNDNTFVLDNPDNTKPEVTITGVPQRTTSTFTATFTFDETVSGFEAADITVTGGTKGTFAEVTSGRVWTLVVTPSADYSLAVAADVATDVDGNGNVAATASGEYAEPPPTPQVTISAGTSPVTEGTAATFTITANPAPTASLTVNVDVSETGNVMSGTSPSSVTINANESSATLTVATDDDQADESNGVVTAEVAAGTGYTVGSSSSASVTVQDNDDPEPPSSSLSAPTVTRALATSMVVNWEPPTGSAISSYDLRYRQSGTTDFIDGPQGVTGTRTIISGLNPDTEYEIQVRASNSTDDGDWSEVGTVRTSTLIPSDRFSFSLDVDDSEGDQFMSFLSVAPDSLVSIQIFGRSLEAIPVNDLSVRFEYDATQVAYEGFKMGPVLSGTSALAGKDLANIGMTLPDSAARVDSGLVGTIRFRATDAISETEIRMVRVELLQGEESETVPMFLSVALQGASLGLLISDPSPDFNGNGTVDTPDFLLFVDVFGLKTGQERYEARYDLDKNDEIGISDFLIFVDNFGKVVPRVPVFTLAPPVTRFVEENTPSGQPIGEPISATSADGEPLTYSLWGVDVAYFAIDASTGQLQTKGTYNFEERNWYSPIVRVSGEKGGRVSIVVGIAIIDVAE